MKRTCWIGLIHVKPVNEQSLLGSAAGGFAVALALAVSSDEFVHRVERFVPRDRQQATRPPLDTRLFPLAANPTSIVDAFGWSYFQLKSLEAPPGKSARDHAITGAVQDRWISLSNDLVQ